MLRAVGLAKTARFASLDGLRAVAAFLVSLWHYQSSVPALNAKLHPDVSWVISQCNHGVEIFFVLSGFAVARSLLGIRLNFLTVGRFMLRRAIRLDPPYLVTLFLVVTLAICNPADWPIRPSPGRVVAHIFYLHGLLRMPNLLGIFWTLCLEIQLYFAFALLYLFAQQLKLVRPDQPQAPEHTFNALLSLSLLWATKFAWTPHDSDWTVTLVPWWPMFCLGVLTERSLRLPAARLWLLGTVILLIARNIWHLEVGSVAALLAVAALCAAAVVVPIQNLFSSRLLTELGQRSYSFYLLHSLVGGMVLNAVRTHVPASAPWDFVRLLLAYFVSGLAAFTLWWLVEAPAQRLGRKIRLTPQPSAT